MISIPALDIFPFLLNIGGKFVGWLPTFFESFRDTVGFIVGLTIPISLFFLIGIIYCVERLKHIRNKEEEMYDAKVATAFDVVDKPDPAQAARFDSVKRHIESDNINDWRQAIIEADIILGNLLDKMGYRGESIGEKLKKIEKSDFETLDDAWEAHKIRNQIAHEGSNFIMSKYEANRVVNLYKKVFEEFYYI